MFITGLWNNHSQYFTFSNIQKNGAESLLESQMKAKYDFNRIENFKTIFKALKWVFVSQMVENRVENFLGYKKNPFFYIDFTNVNLPTGILVTKCT
jgi:hypothetical protein